MTHRQDGIRAIRWSAADALLRHGINFAVMLILARLIAPADFGLFAMMQLFVGIAAVLVDGGFGTALIQRQAVTQQDENSVFWFSLGAGAILFCLLILLAPAIAGFFNRPSLVPLIYAMAFNLLVTAAGAIHVTLLTKALAFRKLMQIGVASAALSGGVSVYLALNGHGVWSLVSQAVTSSVVSLVLLWTYSAWRPTGRFSLEALQDLGRFGRYMLLSAILDVAYGRLYTLLIGRFFAVAELGYFWRAVTTRQMISDGLEMIVGRVAFPMLSARGGDRSDLSRTTQQLLSAMMFVNVPLMIGLAVVVEPFVLVVFGEQWLPAAPVLKVLCLAGALWPLHTVNLTALMVMGRSDLFLRIEVLKKLIGLVAVIAASFHSLMAVAWVQVLVGVIAFFINAYYSGVYLAYRPLQQLADVSPYFLATAGMAWLLWCLEPLQNTSPVIKLFLMVSVSALVYPLLLWLIRRDLLHTNLHLTRRMLGLADRG
ncbi:MAG TPA: lipopolysaccharide biosynthesis protein [Rhodocyclaceae bacterium]|nr:lipopolysaccharide biosynthesis protein [Rhodocyclaceae bacterium]